MSCRSYQGANSSKACRSQFKGSELFRAELEHPAGGRGEAGGGQAEDQSTAADQAGGIFFFLVSSHFHFLVQPAQVADWRRMSAAVAATHPGPGEHHALACRSSRSSHREVGDAHLLSPPHQYNRSLSMDRLKQEVRNYFSMRAFNKSDCYSPSWRCCR